MSPVITGKIYYGFDTSPKTSSFTIDGISTGGNEMDIQISRDLTAGEKAQLDTIMSTIDGLFPTTGGWTRVTMPDLLNMWEIAEIAGGLDVAFVAFDSDLGQHVMMIKEDAVPTKKAAIRQAIKDTIDITRIN